MPVNKFNPSYQGERSKSLEKQVQRFQKLIDSLRQKEIPEAVESLVNEEIEKVNQADTKPLLTAQLSKSYKEILKISERELDLLAKNHYTFKWLAIGMAAFGIPFGVAFGVALDNMAFMGTGIGVGLAIGVAIGSQKDKEVKLAGRQLDVDL
ncbi:hypothetical protein ABWH96_18825 [Marivirga tractuosa]|uniref:hypothetical protein n=1 Tax=Marivirga tractuosa TaxID=1006 RepID=UPI0035CEE592